MVTISNEDVSSFFTSLVHRLRLHGEGLIGTDDGLPRELLDELGAILVQESRRLEEVQGLLCKTCGLHSVDEMLVVTKVRKK